MGPCYAQRETAWHVSMNWLTFAMRASAAAPWSARCGRAARECRERSCIEGSELVREGGPCATLLPCPALQPCRRGSPSGRSAPAPPPSVLPARDHRRRRREALRRPRHRPRRSAPRTKAKGTSTATATSSPGPSGTSWPSPSRTRSSPEWKKWRRDLLPMLPGAWPLVVYEKTRDQFEVVQQNPQRRREIERVVCATDAGPRGRAHLPLHLRGRRLRQAGAAPLDLVAHARRHPRRLRSRCGRPGYDRSPTPRAAAAAPTGWSG